MRFVLNEVKIVEDHTYRKSEKYLGKRFD